MNTVNESIKKAEKWVAANTPSFKRLIKEGGTKKQKKFAADIFAAVMTRRLASSFMCKGDEVTVRRIKDNYFTISFDGDVSDSRVIINAWVSEFHTLGNTTVFDYMRSQPFYLKLNKGE